MDGVRLSINIHGLRGEDNRDGKMCGNLVLSEGKQCSVGNVWMNEYRQLQRAAQLITVQKLQGTKLSELLN